MGKDEGGRKEGIGERKGMKKRERKSTVMGKFEGGTKEEEKREEEGEEVRKERERREVEGKGER